VVTQSVARGAAEAPAVIGLDNAPLAVHAVAPATALPRAEADGVLVDRTYALRRTNEAGSLGTETVWLSTAAPADAAQRLTRAGLVVTRTERAADQEAALSRQGPALALLLFLLGAGAAAALAGGGTVLDLYLLGRRRVAELSAIQALGVRRGSLLRALLLEQGLLVGAGALVGVAVGLAGALLALPSVPEFDEVPPAPPLLFHPSAGLLALLLAAVLVGLTAAIGAAVLALLRGVGPDRLREGPA
jgi:predicted lysophospholipase L1 biosynthesis ABC-type transport system permease subunit